MPASIDAAFVCRDVHACSIPEIEALSVLRGIPLDRVIGAPSFAVTEQRHDACWLARAFRVDLVWRNVKAEAHSDRPRVPPVIQWICESTPQPSPPLKIVLERIWPQPC